MALTSRESDDMACAEQADPTRRALIGSMAAATTGFGAAALLRPEGAAAQLDDHSAYARKAHLPVNIKDMGDGMAGTGGDDKSYIDQAIATLPGGKGIVFFPPGTYKDSALRTLGEGVSFVGSGMGVGATLGATIIKPTGNGPYLTLASGNNLISDLQIFGDRTKTSQDLIKIANNGEICVFDRVGLANAGRDCANLTNAQSVHFNTVFMSGSERYCLFTSGYCNANKFTFCIFKGATQWGVYWTGGTDGHFDRCTFESNNTAGQYGGVHLDKVAANADTRVTLTSCHFENNQGPGGTGKPWEIQYSLGSGIPVELTEIGTEYSEGAPATMATSGHLLSMGVNANVNPFVVMAAGTGEQSALFIGVRGLGNALSVTDPNGRAQFLTRAGLDQHATGPDVIVQQSRVGTDVFARYYRTAKGEQNFGPGATGTDWNLRRLGKNLGGTEFQLQALDGVATKPVGGPVSDASFVTPPPTGMLAVDTSNNQLYVRVGANNWKKVALT